MDNAGVTDWEYAQRDAGLKRAELPGEDGAFPQAWPTSRVTAFGSQRKDFCYE